MMNSRILLLLLPVAISIMVVLFCFVAGRGSKTNIKSGSVEAMNRLVNHFNKQSWFKKRSDLLRIKLSQLGANYTFKREIEPVMYITVKVVMAIVFCFFGWAFANYMISITIIMLIIFMGVIGYFLPDIVLDWSNKSDNKSMMSDIKTIYDNLKIQAAAGVFVTATLSDCYLYVKNKRLKAALLELTKDMIANNDIEEAMQSFNLKFKNKYINTLTITISQSLKSGQSAKMLKDISDQIKDMQHAVSLTEKEKLSTILIFQQLAWFAGILAVILYVLGIESVSILEGLL